MGGERGTGGNGAFARKRLALWEVLNGLLAKYYALEADVKKIAPEATGATGTIGLSQFVQEVGWEEGKEMGDDEVSLTAWETTLANLAAYGANDSGGDSEEES
jgi:hypothetical protein